MHSYLRYLLFLVTMLLGKPANADAGCHTGGCTLEMCAADQQEAYWARQTAHDVVLVALGLSCGVFLVAWGRQFERDRREFRE